jgi:deoxyadenosine/deoxycytidine kinase
MTVTISIEGNIGSGKSTLIDLLKKRFNDEMEFVPEPVEVWTNCNGVNILEKFYENQKKYSYVLQTVIMISSLISQNKITTKPIRITERSSLSNNCFTSNCVDNGDMDETEYAAYKYWSNYLVSGHKPNGFIYFRTDPNVCSERMKIRARSEEGGVSIKYLEQLHDRHEEWFPNGVSTETVMGIPFITINGNIEFKDDKKRQEQIVEIIESFVRGL